MKLCPRCGGLMHHNAYFPAYFCKKCGLMQRGPRANSIEEAERLYPEDAGFIIGPKGGDTHADSSAEDQRAQDTR